VAQWLGVRHALAACNGTAALLAAMRACGVGAGDEVICPSMTYWACAVPALWLGATVHFCDIHPDTLCLDPDDIEHRIGPRTKVIVAVHYAGYPADMDRILPLARPRGVKVIEDISHAHGGLYKGRRCGTMGDITVMSLMSGKPLAIGEGGMTATNDPVLYERCVAFGHYERTGQASRYAEADRQLADPELARFAGLPMGGAKHRMNQACSAMGRVQLAHYPRRMEQIQAAMNRFWDLLEGVPGIRPHRPPRRSGSTMGGWYYPRGHYRPEELGGLPVHRFCEAVRAEAADPAWMSMCYPGANQPLHLHSLFHEADLFRQGRPTVVAFGQRDVRQGPGTLPVSEAVGGTVFGVPWFKHDRPEVIDRFAAAFRKVAEHAVDLLDGP